MIPYLGKRIHGTCDYLCCEERPKSIRWEEITGTRTQNEVTKHEVREEFFLVLGCQLVDSGSRDQPSLIFEP
jgi:hypothetical protein